MLVSLELKVGLARAPLERSRKTPNSFPAKFRVCVFLTDWQFDRQFDFYWASQGTAIPN
jgi:hypothetical protein